MREKVAILFGGPSREHDISISSARHVREHIDLSLYEPLDVFISREGIWEVQGKKVNAAAGIDELQILSDVVFPVLHGTFGEDGTLQELLEKSRIPFVGSGSKTSRVAIDKYKSNNVFTQHNLNVPKSQIVSLDQKEMDLIFPIIIKPLCEGSSVGLYKFSKKEEYEKNLNIIFSVHEKILAQECIIGREFTCGVLEIDGQPLALPLTEIIVSKETLFDYNAKYTVGACREITPANVSLSLTQKIQEIALICHRVLGCSSISRTDMIVTANGQVYVLETNTLPGLTPTSFIPAQAQVYGLSMKDLITTLICSATY